MPLPVVSGALTGWVKSYPVEIITKTVTDHQVIETRASKILLLCLQPMPPEKIARKPEGQRSWRWWSVWEQVRSGDAALKPDDRILVSGRAYRVESISDWGVPSGYRQYDAVEDYNDR